MGEIIRLTGSNGPDRMAWMERRDAVAVKLEAQNKTSSAAWVREFSESQFSALETVFNNVSGGVGAIEDVDLPDQQLAALLCKLHMNEGDALLTYATGNFKEKVLAQLPIE